MEIEKVCKGLCPKCGSSNLRHEDYIFEEEEVSIEFICRDCGAQGWEDYKLVYKVSVINEEE